MIALRGIVRRNEEKKWTWRGVWTFGVLPDDEEAALNAKNPTVRPFVYTWEEARNASDVLVPSANVKTEPQVEEKAGDSSKEEKKPSEAVAGTPKETVDEPKDAADSLKTEAASPQDAEIADTKAPDETDEKPADKASPTGEDKAEGEGVKPMEVDETSDSKKDEEKGQAMEIPVKPMEVDETCVSKKDEDMKEEEETATKPEEESKLEPTKSNEEILEKPGEQSKTDSVEDKDDADKPQEKDDANKPQEKDDADKSKDPVQQEEMLVKKEAVTFATTSPDEPPFTDAATKHPEKCPPGGAWKGYFETATNRKDKSTTQIPENFCMFLNATPSNDARVLFLLTDEEADDAKKEKKDNDNALLPSGHIHVRGCGLNQYGTWELIGSLNVETGVLECQRMYVRTEADKPKIPGRRGRPRKSAGRKVTIDDVTLATTTPRSSRKRQASWRKRASLSEDDETDVSTRRSTGTGKRGRPRKNPVDVSSTTPGFMFSPSGTIVSVPSAGSTKRSPVSTPRGPAKGAMSGQKRRASQPKSSPPTGSSDVKLPHAGDPNEARWRAAHFLYYQRYDPSSDDGASPSSSADAASFVVYEGEMSQGNCLRDGRGVCLYNNGTLYEGDWKRNKEHGIGTLMTADRRRVIYKGEWERGRIHGRGVYYYTQDNPFASRRKDASGEQLGSRYEGDFKENTRHGTGKYFLPDGSVYTGDWRADQMTGSGTFKWPDGSVYVGNWKDAKRNGQGILQASNGFTYDGMWVQNAMEGRGIATYPGGQRYEGMFSNGRREGRGSIHFANGAVYEGRFRDDCMEGTGTMKMTSNAPIPHRSNEEDEEENGDQDEDWMIPISFQSDMGHIHQKAGFTVEGE